MGNTVSELVSTEKTNWVKNHALEIDTRLRDQQLALLQNFGERIHLCSRRCQMMGGLIYYHYFITDNTWSIEFGGGAVLDCTTMVHNNPQAQFELEGSFTKTQDITDRMKKVCGARGYSLCLRNCEHMARYILTGSWVSKQTLDQGNVGAKLARFMLKEHQALLNTPPVELATKAPMTKLYPDQEGFLTFEGSPEALAATDRSAFNILVLGPTGCGKSRIINLLYNQHVCESAGSAVSVTKNIQITSGRGTVYGRRRKVNIIDTIGFCDSTLSSSEVQALIKDKVRQNLMYVDRVVMICSGRVEGQHVESLQKVMAWLQYDRYPWNFTFVYNKADQLRPEQREENLVQMCNLIGAANHHIRDAIRNDYIPSNVYLKTCLNSIEVRRVFPLKLACGFPEASDHEGIQDDLLGLLDNIFLAGREEARIPAEESWCSIL